MGVFERIKVNLQNQLRSFVLGEAVVTPSMQGWGVDPSVFAPDEYGNYLAKSNSVYTCATGRADLLITLQPKLYRVAKNGDRTEVTSGKLKDLLDSVNPYWTWRRLLRMTELSMCLWGECFWFLERGPSGKSTPQEIWWGKPSKVTVFPHPEKYIRGFEYEVNAQRLWFDPSEVIWFRFENPIDEYSGLSPLAAARLAADYANDAVRSNRNLFVNGNQMGGIVSPKDNLGSRLNGDQVAEIENQMEKRSRGVDKAHRWHFFKIAMEAQEFGVTPKDAEFLGGLAWSLEEVCRAYKWPLDLVGGQRTYENYGAAMKAAYTHAVIPEATYLASEIMEQLIPMFAGEADLMEFDGSEVDILQEGEGEEWTRAQGQITIGAITINEWRKKKGLEPKPWGDTWWAPMTNMQVEDLMNRPELPAEVDPLPGPPPSSSKDTLDTGGGDEAPVDEAAPSDETTPADGEPVRGKRGVVEFGSKEHEVLWRAFDERASRWEKRFSQAVIKDFERQKESVLAQLENSRSFVSELQLPSTAQQKDAGRSGNFRSAEDVAKDPFGLKKWIKEFRLTARRVLTELVADAAKEGLKEVGIQLVFDVAAPQVIRYIEQQTQRFAKQVNETTWQRLKDSLAEGVEAGEGIDKLKKRVEDVMGERIRSTPETIARTEVIGASNGGRLLAYDQSGVVPRKKWLAALDARTRESHLAAHKKYQAEPIGLHEYFVVGSGRGKAPGQLGVPQEDINCRCMLQPVVEED